MGSMLDEWPSFNPHNFSQLRPDDSSNPSKLIPLTYHPTHERTRPPPGQVISSENKHILIRQFYPRSEGKSGTKRAASENLMPEDGLKHPRTSAASTPN